MGETKRPNLKEIYDLFEKIAQVLWDAERTTAPNSVLAIDRDKLTKEQSEFVESFHKLVKNFEIELQTELYPVLQSVYNERSHD